jgi:hypothetical protein
MWAARDQDGQLFLYDIKPSRKSDGNNEWPNLWDNGNYNMPLDKTLFPDLKWGNEPLKVELKAVQS